MNDDGPPVWLVAGPTASGKSAAAIALARRSGAEIINADSMQVYRDLRVLTARPTAEEEAAAPHHLFGLADAAQAWSVGHWLRAAVGLIGEIAARGAPVIVVGGTGLYFRALTQGLAEIPDTAGALRAQVAAQFAVQGEATFRARLAAADPRAEARIAPGDRQRLTRAMEVFEASGRPLSAWQAETRPPLATRAWRGVVANPERDELYRRSDARLTAMVGEGALEEVRALLARRLDPSLPAMKALGVAAFGAHLRGELSLPEALDLAQMETRRYAKRQMLWFRRQARDWPRVGDLSDIGAVAAALAI